MLDSSIFAFPHCIRYAWRISLNTAALTSSIPTLLLYGLPAMPSKKSFASNPVKCVGYILDSAATISLSNVPLSSSRATKSLA